MAAEIINLRRVRKQKARICQEQTAAENRAAFSQTKAEKLQATAEIERRAKVLAGHKRDTDDAL